MLGMIAGPEPVLAEKLFRFAVKCDRAFNRRIEAAAKKAGLSPDQFVQAHFETIFDRDAAEASSELRRAFAAVDPVTFSRKRGITLMAARAFIWLAGRAGEAGLAKATLRELAAAAGSDSVTTGSRLRDELLNARLIAVAMRGNGLAGSTFRICEAR